MGHIRKQQLEAKMNREQAIKLAISMVGTINKSTVKKAGEKVSIRAAAEAYGIPFSTLKDRLKGTQPRVQAHIKQQLLSPTEEKSVIR